MKRLIITKRHDFITVAFDEDGTLLEYYVETPFEKSHVGNIYRGKITNYLKNMETAYVDIGQDQNVFLPNQGVNKRILKPQTDIMVQVAADAIGSKRMKVTADINITGYYLLLLPTTAKNGISGKLRQLLPKEKLDEIDATLLKLNTHGVGLVARTAFVQASFEQLQKEYDRLYAYWEALQVKYDNAPSCSLVDNSFDLISRVFCDFAGQGVEKVYVNDLAILRGLKARFGELADRLLNIAVEDDRIDIYDQFGLMQQIKDINRRRVDLKCGGYLIIDCTEALDVIDVNSGSFQGKNGLATSILQLNLEAAEAVAREIRLRNLCGIIIVDFVDMNSEKDKQILLEKMRELISHDRMRADVGVQMTKLGLMEISRRRALSGVRNKMGRSCRHCGGTGVEQVASIAVAQMYRDIEMYVEQQHITNGVICEVGELMYYQIMTAIEHAEGVDDWVKNRKINFIFNKMMGDVEYKLIYKRKLN